LVLRKPGRVSRRRVVRGLIALALLPFAYEAFRVLVWTNRHAVVPGRVYRCSQPSASELRELARDWHIRTVLNLRGVSPDYDWYQAEARTSHDLNISQEDITLSANRLPPPGELRRLIEVLDHTEYPILIHCKRGADRTGMVSAIVLLLSPDSSFAEAKRQLWPRYGHFEFGRTAALDTFIDYYETWLAQQGVAHTPERFRHWVLDVYSPGPARSELIWLDEVPNPVPANRGFAVRVRAVNRSNVPWELKPGNYAGVHLGFVVANEKLESVYRGQAGLLRATVPPGESIDLTIAVPPLHSSGRYALVAQMQDATEAGVPVRATSFVQFGDESIMAEVTVK
jgi:hypothetical protein